MPVPDYESARSYVLERLEKDLSPDLVYHSAAHTFAEVIPAVDRLSAMERVDEKDRLMLRTAALFHDLGYIEVVDEHEESSARLARQVLPGLGYNAGQVEEVCCLILATRMPRTPQTLLEEILADADLDNLGRSDFMQRSLDLRQEWGNSGRQWTDQEWYASQLEFLTGHCYFTASARYLREAGKEENIREIRKALTSFSPSD